MLNEEEADSCGRSHEEVVGMAISGVLAMSQYVLYDSMLALAVAVTHADFIDPQDNAATFSVAEQELWEAAMSLLNLHRERRLNARDARKRRIPQMEEARANGQAKS